MCVVISPMKRLILCASCLIGLLTLAIALVMAIGEEIVQREKTRDWREALAQ